MYVSGQLYNIAGAVHNDKVDTARQKIIFVSISPALKPFLILYSVCFLFIINRVVFVFYRNIDNLFSWRVLERTNYDVT